MSIPLAIMTDSASGNTGLGRIGRELALRIHAELSDVFRVGVIGIGGNYSSRLPFPNYPIRQLQNMIPLDLPSIWKDFAGEEKGIMLAIENISWLSWLASPERLPPGLPLKEFLGSGSGKLDSLSQEQWAKLSPQMQTIIGKKDAGPFKKWLYCPVDGDVDGTLGKDCEPILRGFDRVLAYTAYGAEVIAKTLNMSAEGALSLPHGIDTDIFYPRDRAEARKTLVSRLSNGASAMEIRDDTVLLGVCATNSYRKDWGLAFETCQELLRRGLNVFLWGHTNCLQADQGPQGYWNILSLAHQFGMAQRVVLTTANITDDNMAWCLSALDCGLHIGTGEGFGYYGPECLACGVPVVHGNYAGGAELLPKEYLVDYPAYRLEGRWMIRRPAFRATDWADRVEFCLTPEGKALAKLPEYLAWDNCWPSWSKWLRLGLE
jgi:glycosyltransferase involved in cell wall biosynthesis